MKWLLLAIVALAAAAACVAVMQRAFADRRAPALPPPSPAPPPPPPAPRVAPGDHSQTPLFPALDPAEKLHGYIDATGAFVIAPQYSEASPFSEGLAFVVEHQTGRQLCIDKNNQVRFALENPLPTGWIRPESGFAGGLALVIVEGTGAGNRYTYVRSDGQLLGPPRFFPAEPFSEGLAPVAIDGRWGFLAEDGSLAIPLHYDEAFPFSEGLAAVVRKDKLTFIGRDGRQLIKRRFELARDFHEGLAAVQPGSPGRGESTDWGYIDRTGRMKIRPRFADAHPFSEGRARVSLAHDRKQVGFIDVEGKLVIPAEHDDASDFHGGLAAVRAGQAWGYIDRDGRLVIPPTLDMASDFSDGLARVRARRADPKVPRNVIREGYIDAKGSWVYVWEREDVPSIHRIPPP